MSVQLWKPAFCDVTKSRSKCETEDVTSSPASPISQTQVTEETRLAVAVHYIDEEVSVVPRGAFVKDPHAIVKVNRSFGGKYGCWKWGP